LVVSVVLLIIGTVAGRMRERSRTSPH